MADQTCPSCGREVPSELGQHAGDLVSALVTCPHCGSQVTLRKQEAAAAGDVPQAGAAPPGRSEGTEAFSGQETLGDLADELRNKPA